MKKIGKKALAILMATLITVLTFSTVLCSAADNISDVPDFNLFRDAGEITDEFISACTELTQRNWSENYFSSIVITLGDSKMSVDGREASVTVPASLDDNGEIMIPITELSETIGAECEIDNQTGEISINHDGKEIELNSPCEDATLFENNTSNNSLSIGSEDVSISDDNIVTQYMDNGSIIEQLPVISESQAERDLGLTILRENDKLVITNPYQTKEIILFVKGGHNLENNYGASDVVTNHEGLYFLQYSSEELTKTAYAAFASDPNIQYVTLNKVVSIDAIPDGSWGTDGNNNSMGIQAGIMKNHLQSSSNQITVAVVDTGVDATHSHLQGRLVNGWDFTTNTSGLTVDDNNHGTHVAGTIVDCTPDNVKIMPIKCFNSEGKSFAVGDDWSLAAGIKKAVDLGAQVINISAGGYDDAPLHESTQAEIDAIEYAKANNVVVVAAAGNNCVNADNHYPAALSTTQNNVVAVAAVDEYDLPADFSNYGDAIDVCAPGVDIKSSIPGGGYQAKSGTSMATPHVSAAVAMLMLEYSDYTPLQIKNTLKGMTVDLGTPGWDQMFGSGRIDFRMLNTDGLSQVAPVYSTDFNLRQISFASGVHIADSINLDYGMCGDGVRVQAIVSPKDATNKSITYTSSNTNIASYEGGMILPKGIGRTSIIASKAGIASKTCTVNIIDNWINHAADSYAGGSGTESDPYLIATASQLAKLAYETRINKKYYSGTHFKLTDNIDLGAYSWTPIGTADYKGNQLIVEPTFQGVFDGNNHYISNMNVAVSKGRDWEFLGLFGYISGDGMSHTVEIKNLAVINANVTNGSIQDENSGILGGFVYDVNISNAFTEGVTTGGGLVGSLRGSVATNCYSLVSSTNGAFVVDNLGSHITNCFSASDDCGFCLLQDLKNSAVINSFATTISGISMENPGFIKYKMDGAITKCYYSDNYTTGIYYDKSSDTNNLIAKPESFFKTKSTYTTASNWDSSSPWDFENTWDIDENYQNGLPYLKAFRRDVTNISLNKTTLKLQKGKSETLTATITPSDATYKTLKWTSSNTGVATVDQTGKVTAKASSGTAVITATATDGSGKSATCTFYADDHGDTAGTATSIALHSKISGKIEVSGDADYFKFTPTTTGTYIFYTTGSTDTKGYLYDSNKTQLAYNDDGGIAGSNFATKYNLTAGQTYYIRVEAYSTKTGPYTFIVTKGVYSASLADDNQDARHVQMQAQASSVLTTLKLHIGSTTYTLNKPASGNLDTTVNGARFKVTFTSASGGLSTVWKIDAKIPSSTTAQTVYFSFSKGKVTDVDSAKISGFVPYKSSIKTGINVNSDLQTLLNSMASTGYTLSVRNWDNILVNVTKGIKAATGMKIFKKDSGGRIVEIYYVVVFGDVTGNGVVGDGVIGSDDALASLQHAVGKSQLPTVIAQLAADVDHDGSITSADANTILQAGTGKITLNQSYVITNVPDECYFLDPVTF